MISLQTYFIVLLDQMEVFGVVWKLVEASVAMLGGCVVHKFFGGPCRGLPKLWILAAVIQHNVAYPFYHSQTSSPDMTEL